MICNAGKILAPMILLKMTALKEEIGISFIINVLIMNLLMQFY